MDEVLYHHMRDRAFGSPNAAEYHTQMLRYYANGITLVEVVPRQIGDNHYILVCLKHKEETRNTICELASSEAMGGYLHARQATLLREATNGRTNKSAHAVAPPSAPRHGHCSNGLSGRA